MPTYVYAIVNADGSDGPTFEIMQRMTDAALTKDPTSGKPVRRVIQAPHVAGEWSEGATRSKLSDKNLDRLGFTKYVNAGGGHFEKRAGKGPERLAAD